jgi:glycosyltransferase involved in cell wall biosynthesis
VGSKTVCDKEFECLGWVSANELRSLYENSDVCLYLMFSRHPGVIPLECMDTGAIVVTNSKHLKHSYLIHEYNALVVEPTINSLVNAFEKLLNDIELRKRLVVNGYKTVDVILGDHSEKLEKMFEELTRTS